MKLFANTLILPPKSKEKLRKANLFNTCKENKIKWLKTLTLTNHRT